MNRINVLSKEISELIAAGEVIERPCSVIKEVLENSIDSGANIITVEIKNGGISYMRVTDNGCGISENDIPLAFLRHATSKIKSKEDLESIITLGFRGEALASISAVSKVDVITKRLEDEYGTHYTIEGSEEKQLERSGCPDGTTIIIRDLFYNVPARLKFLKKAVSEGNAIASVVNKIALSHPEISFKFIRDNKQELITPGDGKLYSAIYSVFGKDFAKSLIPVNFDYNNIKVTGYTVKPLLSRSNRAFQNFFINNRYVKSVTCTVSLEEAYRNSIMTGKFPCCVLNLEIAPDIVDVNVHPAKIEVRFSDEKIVFDSVYFSIKNALLENDIPTELKLNDKPNFTKTELYDVKPVEVEKPQQLQMNLNNISFNSKQEEYLPEKSDNVIFEKKIEPNIITIDNKVSHYEKPTEKSEDIRPPVVKEDLSDFKYLNQNAFLKKEEPVVVVHQAEPEKEPEIKIIGEAFTTYIIAQIDDELLLIDKHAAHERYIFEKIKNDNLMLNTQLLLEPIYILLSYEEYDAFITNKDIINNLGFSFNEFEGTKIVIDGIPTVLNNTDISDLIPELATNLIMHKKNPSNNVFDELFHSFACKSAIKANDKSDKLELLSLVKKIYNDNYIKYCPHGRPVLIKLTKKEIEKQFKRVL